MRRQKIWSDTFATYSAATTPQATDLLADYRSTAGSVVVGTTVMGTHLQHVASVQAGTGTYVTRWRVGLLVDSSTAAVTELPDPITEPYEDWLWNADYYLGNNTLGWLDQATPWHQPIKSRRRLGELEQTLWLIASPSLGGATSLNYTFHTRVLLALP